MKIKMYKTDDGIIAKIIDNEKKAEELFKLNKESAIKRFEFYKKLSEEE